MLKKLPWGNSEYFTKLAALLKGKDITREYLLSSPRDTSKVYQSTHELVSNSRISFKKWNGAQRIFKNNPNRIMIFSALGASFTDKSYKEKCNLMWAKNEHPSTSIAESILKEFFVTKMPEFSETDRYSVGWVRYTQFGKDIWIDEIQSDLSKIIDDKKIASINTI